MSSGIEVTYPGWGPTLPGQGSVTVSVEVDDKAMRLGLQSTVSGDVIVQTDDDSVWLLKEGGIPANENDWEMIGRRSIRFLGSVNGTGEMTSLINARRGDWVVRSDLGRRYDFVGSDPEDPADWFAMPEPKASARNAAGVTVVRPLALMPDHGEVDHAGKGLFPLTREVTLVGALDQAVGGESILITLTSGGEAGATPTPIYFDETNQRYSTTVSRADASTYGALADAINPLLAEFATGLSIYVGPAWEEVEIDPFLAELSDTCGGGFHAVEGDRIIVQVEGSQGYEVYFTRAAEPSGEWLPMPSGAPEGHTRSFGGQLEAVDQAASSFSSLMTRRLVQREALLAMGDYRELCPGLNGAFNSAGTAAACVPDGLGFRISPGSSAAGWSRVGITRDLGAYRDVNAQNAPCANSFAIGILGQLDVPSGSNGALVRIVVGDAGSGAPPAVGADALSARGWGVQFAYKSGSNVAEAKIFTHDGAAYSLGVGVDLTIAPTGMVHLILVKDGGSIKLHAMGGASFASPLLGRISDTPVLTKSGAPTSGEYGGGGWLSAIAINHPTVFPTSLVGFRVMSARLLMGNF